MPRHQFNLNSPVNPLQPKINENYFEKLVAGSVYASIRQMKIINSIMIVRLEYQ